ncbi:hypothetical protein Hdeb2414_s0009g00298691 [Helianthus debilis subsp. tardiflorus]
MLVALISMKTRFLNSPSQRIKRNIRCMSMVASRVNCRLRRQKLQPR